MARRRKLRDDQGETLLELVVAIAILGVCVVAVASGLALAIRASAIHRSQANAGVYVRNYAEALETAIAGGAYVDCATTASYPGYTPPDPTYTAAVQKVEYWSGSAWNPSCGVDKGVQRLTIDVTSPDNGPASGAKETLVVVLRKPCAGVSSC